MIKSCSGAPFLIDCWLTNDHIFPWSSFVNWILIETYQMLLFSSFANFMLFETWLNFSSGALELIFERWPTPNFCRFQYNGNSENGFIRDPGSPNVINAGWLIVAGVDYLEIASSGNLAAPTRRGRRLKPDPKSKPWFRNGQMKASHLLNAGTRLRVCFLHTSKQCKWDQDGRVRSSCCVCPKGKNLSYHKP